MAAVLARGFAREPFFSWLTGDAPERNLRMRMGWAGILRRASAGLREALLSLVLERADAAGTPTCRARIPPQTTIGSSSDRSRRYPIDSSIAWSLPPAVRPQVPHDTLRA